MKKSRSDLWWRIAILATVIVVLFFALLWNLPETGKVILELRPEIEGRNLTGVLRMHMREGELIPASTKVVATLGNQRKEYRLYDLVQGERIRGDFFVEEADIRGEGEGYGFPGTRLTYPSIRVRLAIEQEIVDEEVVDEDDDSYSPPADCNDGDEETRPGVEERCNGADDNCDGQTDEGCQCVERSTRPCGSDVGKCELGEQTCLSGVWGECLGNIEPDENEECNQVDDDCDGDIDEEEMCRGPLQSHSVFDADRDGFSPPEDCDDSDGEVYPDAPESCNNKDDNCNEEIDEDLGSMTCGVGNCETTVERCIGGVLQECVPYSVGVEQCNQEDDDCDGEVDEERVCSSDTIESPDDGEGSDTEQEGEGSNVEGDILPSGDQNGRMDEEGPMPQEDQDDGAEGEEPLPQEEDGGEVDDGGREEPLPSEDESAGEDDELLPEEEIEDREVILPEDDGSTSPSPAPSGSPDASANPTLTGFMIRFIEGFNRLTGYLIGFTGYSFREYAPSPFTGRAVTIDQRIVEIVVQAGENASIELREGETIRVIEARTENREVNLDQIHLTESGNNVIISTTYTEEQSGFGREFLTEDLHPIGIELQSLRLRPVNGMLNIELFYRGEEILDIAREIEVEEERREERDRDREEETGGEDRERNLTQVNVSQCQRAGFSCRARCLSFEERKNFSCATGMCCGIRQEAPETGSCEEQGGEICEGECDGAEFNLREGICCLGTCQENNPCEAVGFSCKDSCDEDEEIKAESCEEGICCGTQGEERNCDDLGGEICDSYHACPEEEEESVEGGCCLAGCEVIEDSEEEGTEQAGTRTEDEEIEEELESEVQETDIPGVRVEAITARNFLLGAVARFAVLIDNRRKAPLEDIYVNILLGDVVFKSPVKTIPAQSKTEIIAYGDTSGLEEGVYSGRVIFVYDGKSYEKEIWVKVERNSVSVVLDPGKSRLRWMIIAIVVIAIFIGGGFVLMRLLHYHIHLPLHHAFFGKKMLKRKK